MTFSSKPTYPANTPKGNPKKRSTPFGWKCTKLLEKANDRDTTKKRSYAPTNWATAFDAMPAMLGASKDRIIKVLQWLVEHKGGQFTPQAKSPSMFRTKFLQIEAAMRRVGANDVSHSLEDPNIQQWVDEVINETGNLIWPGAEKEQELSFVQISLASYQKFLNDLYSHLARLRGIAQAQRGPVKRLTDHLRADKASESILERFTQGQIAAQLAELEFFVNRLPFEGVGVISQWLVRVHKFAKSVKTWDGHLLGMVWQRRHRWVQQEYAQLMAEWDCDENAYERLIKEMDRLYA